MPEGEGQSLETQGEEASKDANVTIDEPTAPALDLSPDPNTEWEKAGAEAGSDEGAESKGSSDGEGSDAGDSEDASEPEGDGSLTEDTSDDTDDDSGQS